MLLYPAGVSYEPASLTSQSVLNIQYLLISNIQNEVIFLIAIDMIYKDLLLLRTMDLLWYFVIYLDLYIYMYIFV